MDLTSSAEIKEINWSAVKPYKADIYLPKASFCRLRCSLTHFSVMQRTPLVLVLSLTLSSPAMLHYFSNLSARVGLLVQGRFTNNQFSTLLGHHYLMAVSP